MNTEEAIMILTPSSKDEALEDCKDYRLRRTEEFEAIQMAVSALRTQLEYAKLDRSRWNGCKLCTEDEIVIQLDSDFEFALPAEYCPNCGRPLTEEAWADLERRIGCNDEKTDRTD